MSNQPKHTAEPWKLHRDGQSVGTRDGYGVCEVWPRDEDNFPDTEGKANARRIVACVNACEGIPTDDLENAPRHGLLRLAEFSDKLLEQRDQLLKQRDQLLAALEMYEVAHLDLFSQCWSNPVTNAWGKQVDMTKLNEAHEAASKAIAAAKGGAA